ncbi:MAG: transcriptional regulator BetI [Paracoccaceae bacterium]
MAPQAKRTRINDIRRPELIAAAHRVFLAHGLGGLTTARICAEAGMSPGILAYYFTGKDQVLFEMVRYNNRILMEDVITRLHAARTPWDRLVAIVEGNFPASAYDRNTANAWLSVCAAAATNPQYARLQRIFYRRLNSNLASAFGGALTPDRLRQLSLAISALIDGLWLRKSAGGDVTREAAVDLVMAQISGALTPRESANLKSAITFKWADQRDYKTLGAVMFDAVRRGESRYTEAQKAAWVPAPPDGTSWSARLADQDIIAAEQDGTILGFMTLAPQGYIDFAFIRPWAQHTGLFRRLYTHLETKARRSGEQRLWLHASVMAEPAFTAMGFSITHKESVPIAQETLDRFVMEKRL